MRKPVHLSLSLRRAELIKRCKFLSSDVPSPPTSVHLSGIGSRSLEITWTTEHNGNSPILSYIIEYSNVPGTINSNSMIITSH